MPHRQIPRAPSDANGPIPFDAAAMQHNANISPVMDGADQATYFSVTDFLDSQNYVFANLINGLENGLEGAYTGQLTPQGKTDGDDVDMTASDLVSGFNANSDYNTNVIDGLVSLLNETKEDGAPDINKDTDLDPITANVQSVATAAQHALTEAANVAINNDKSFKNSCSGNRPRSYI